MYNWSHYKLKAPYKIYSRLNKFISFFDYLSYCTIFSNSVYVVIKNVWQLKLLVGSPNWSIPDMNCCSSIIHNIRHMWSCFPKALVVHTWLYTIYSRKSKCATSALAFLGMLVCVFVCVGVLILTLKAAVSFLLDALSKESQKEEKSMYQKKY